MKKKLLSLILAAVMAGSGWLRFKSAGRSCVFGSRERRSTGRRGCGHGRRCKRLCGSGKSGGMAHNYGTGACTERNGG